jgi:hypothetical protein
LLPAVPLEVHAERTRQDDYSKSLPPGTALWPRTGLRGSNQTGAPCRRANSGRVPVCAGPHQGLSVRSFQTISAGSLGQVGRPVTGTTLRVFASATVSGFFLSELPAGFPKGISSDHHRFVETRKGAPTNWVGTPDALHLEPQTPFAKSFFAIIPAKKSENGVQLPLPLENSDDGSTLTPGPMVDDIATRLM